MTLPFSLMLGGYALGVVSALLAPNARTARRGTAIGAVVGAAAGLALALRVLASGTPFELAAPTLLSIADGLAFRLDALGALFLIIIGLVAVPCAIYGAAYSEGYEGRYSLGLLGAMLNLFLLTMSPVVAWINRCAARARAIQSGSAHAYLTYLVVALLGLLGMLLVRGT